MTQQTSINNLYGILARSTGLSIDEIRAYNDDEKYHAFNRMKLPEIKEIVRDLKANGYSSIGMTGNKPHFIGLLIKILKGDIAVDNYTRAEASIHTTQAKAAVVAAPQVYITQPIPQPAKASQQSLPKVFNDINSRINSILNTPHKKEAFNVLCGYKGIKKEEILTVLANYGPNTAINPEEVILAIVANRQSEETFLQQQQRLENEQYDKAVIESEKERDLSKIRKRQQLEAFKVRFELPLLNSEELSASCLLHGLQPPASSSSSSSSNSSSSSSSSSSGGGEVIDLSFDEDPESSRIDHLRYEGCYFVRQIVLALDRCCGGPAAPNSASSPSSSSSSSSCSDLSAAARLRRSVTQLLLVEVDTIKAFHRQAFAYIVKMGRRIDGLLNASQPQQLLAALARLSADGNEGDGERDGQAINRIIEALDRRHFKFTRGLYKLPTDGHIVPLILREAVAQMGLKLVELDADGLEEVELPENKIENGNSRKRPASAIEELSDSTVSSWPDEDEDEDMDEK